MAQELRRKSIHLLGLIFPILYVFTTRHNAIIGVGCLLAFVLGIELLKALLPAFSGYVHAYLFPDAAFPRAKGRTHRCNILSYRILSLHTSL